MALTRRFSFTPCSGAAAHYIRTKLQSSEAFAIWRGRAAEWTRPAACGGTRDMELARTKRFFLPTFSGATEKVGRRRHSCGVIASTEVRCKSEKRADVGIGPYKHLSIKRGRAGVPTLAENLRRKEKRKRTWSASFVRVRSGFMIRQWCRRRGEFRRRTAPPPGRV